MNKRKKNYSIRESSKLSNLLIIDLLAHEYGWSIEYIQSLSMHEIRDLVKTIIARKDGEDLTSQVNINKGFSGKIGSNRPPSETERKKKEEQELIKLAKVLNAKVSKVEKKNE